METQRIAFPNDYLIARFWERVAQKDAQNCWDWIGSIGTTGYGHFMYKLKTYSAPRLSWAINKGPIPPDLCVLHTCDNRKCVNPNHLYLGNKKDNMRDMWNRHRANRSQQGEKNNNAHLTNAQVSTIRQKIKENPHRGLLAQLSREYNVYPSNISYIKSGRIWKGVGELKQEIENKCPNVAAEKRKAAIQQAEQDFQNTKAEAHRKYEEVKDAK